MPLKALRLPGQKSLAEELYDGIKESILNGTLRPGERLVETEVAEAASTSRTPVREALHRLAVDGLVQANGRSVKVAELSSDELADLCAVRETLEGMAARLAATAASEVLLLGLRRILEAYREALKANDTLELVALNHAFHEMIWDASGNRYLARHLETLRGLIEQMQETTLSSPGRSEQTAEEHERIFELIAARDGAGAAEFARVHFREAMALRLMMRRGGPRG